MRTVWIYYGLPASGKTTEALKQVENSNGSIKRVNKDSLREMLDSRKWSKGNEKYILQLRDHIILTVLDLGKSVIVDDTNFEPKHEERIRELVSDYNKGKYGENYSKKNPVQVKVKFFHITPEEAIKRDLKRVNSVGSGVIWDMYNKYLKSKEKEIKPLKQNSDLPNAIIVDIDGTIALPGNRNPYNYSKVNEDEPNNPIIEIIRSYLLYEDLSNYRNDKDIIFVSGREDICRQMTEEWIEGNISVYFSGGIKLFMRKTGDKRKDSVVKKEIFDNYIKDKYYIDFVLDDRLQVCRMWHQLGLTVLRVGDPDANF